MKTCVLCQEPIEEGDAYVTLGSDLAGGGPAHKEEWRAVLDYAKQVLRPRKESTDGP